MTSQSGGTPAAPLGSIIFLHGLESGPGGTKATWLRERYAAVTPALDTSEAIAVLAPAHQVAGPVRMDVAAVAAALARPLEQATGAVAAPETRLVVGSSFGGALLLELMHRGQWRGPALFLAGAGVRLTTRRSLPAGCRAILVHGRDDDLVPLDDARLLAATGGPGVQLWEVGDGHRLTSILDDGTLDAAIAWLLRG